MRKYGQFCIFKWSFCLKDGKGGDLLQLSNDVESIVKIPHNKWFLMLGTLKYRNNENNDHNTDNSQIKSNV